MANDNLQRSTFEDEPADDELRNLFSAFDEVSASDELVEATIARITPKPESATVPKRAKWRAIRVMALAACLTLALGGGVAYATPTSYYDIVQDGTTVTLGVNCFGITVSSTSGDEAGEELVSSTTLRGIPYEESLARAIDALEERNPNAPIEYGMQGEEREVVPPAAPANGHDGPDAAMNGQAQRDDAQGQGAGQPPAGEPNAGAQGGESWLAEPNQSSAGQPPSNAGQNENGPAEGAGPNEGER